jgi:hypothetical protein
MTTFSIRFLRGKRDEDAISVHSRAVLTDLQRAAGVAVLPISSMARTAAEQARAMFANIRATSVAKQRTLYGRFGDQIISVYERLHGKSDAEIIVAMTNEIVRVGPQNVSRHCADQSVVQVFDIPPSEVEDAAEVRLVAAARLAVTNGAVSKLLLPPKYGGSDPAIHVEIMQPKVGAA